MLGDRMDRRSAMGMLHANRSIYYSSTTMTDSEGGHYRLLAIPSLNEVEVSLAIV